MLKTQLLEKTQLVLDKRGTGITNFSKTCADTVDHLKLVVEGGGDGRLCYLQFTAR
jgi:hypothetical protein